MSMPASDETTQNTTAPSAGGPSGQGDSRPQDADANRSIPLGPDAPDAWDHATLWLAKHGALPAV